MGNRKSRDLGWETADQLEKRDRGLKMGGKPLTSVKKGSRAQGGENRGENAGSKVQSPSWAAGVTHIWSIYGFDMAQVQVGQRGKYKRG